MVKKIKAARLNLPQLLLQDPAAVPALLRNRRDLLDIVDELFILFSDPLVWDDLDVPGRAAQVLVALGHEDEVVETLLTLADEHLEVPDVDDDLEFIVLQIVFAVGQVITERSLPLVLDHLDTLVEPDDTFAPWASDLLMLVAQLGERGVRDERGWLAFERLRKQDPGLWAAHVARYGDDRAVAGLCAVVDGIDDGFDDDKSVDIVIECVCALEDAGKARERDLTLLARARALRTGAGAPDVF